MSTDDDGGPGTERTGAGAERARASSRAALVAAALDELSEKGYEAATVAGIAERAGVTTGALYAHFESKLDLLLETVGMKSVDGFVRTMHTAAALPWSEAVELLAAQLTRRPGRRALLLLEAIVVARRDPVAASTLRHGLDAYLAVSAEAAREGVAAGVVDPAVGADDLARLFVAISFGLLVLAAVDEAWPSDEALVRTVDMLLQSDGRRADEQPASLARVRARSAAAARTGRDLEAAIAAAAEEGHSLRSIGAAAGVSHEGIRRLLAKRHVM